MLQPADVGDWIPRTSGVYVLPPREKADTGLDVYRGTADAISQNIDFIDQYDPEYLLYFPVTTFIK